MKQQDLWGQEHKEELCCAIALQDIFTPGSTRADYVTANYPTAQSFLQAGEGAWRKMPAMRKNKLDQLACPNYERAEKILRQCKRNDILVLPFSHPNFPPQLREIRGVPLVLYLWGNPDLLTDKLLIGMVGTRSPTGEGLALGHRMACRLAQSGAVVVSGMAMGIDSACHAGALSAGGKTVGVLGCGLLADYPKDNRGLRMETRDRGAILSEYPPDTYPDGRLFPPRNRLISGLSAGVVVVEASPKSGAAITARYAQEQGKDLFVLPWSLMNPAGQYCVQILQEGAVPVAKPEDILSVYDYSLAEREPVNEQLRLEVPTPVPQKKRKAAALPKTDSRRAILPGEDLPEENPFALEGTGNFEEKSFLERGNLPPEPPEGLTSEQQQVYLCLGSTPCYPAEIAGATGIPIARLMAVLTELELLGLAEACSGGRFLRLG